jgi:hypothetical protein
VSQARFLLDTYAQPVIAEEFLPGAEFTCGVLGNGASAEVLPIVAINFASLPSGAVPIYGYEAKWIWDTPSDPLDIFECPAKIDASPPSSHRRRRPPRISHARLPRLVADRRSPRRRRAFQTSSRSTRCPEFFPIPKTTPAFQSCARRRSVL